MKFFIFCYPERKGWSILTLSKVGIRWRAKTANTHMKGLSPKVKRRVFPSATTTVPVLWGPSYGIKCKEFWFLIKKTRQIAANLPRHIEDNHDVLWCSGKCNQQTLSTHKMKNQSLSSNLNIILVSEFKVLNFNSVASPSFTYQV